VFDDPRQKLRWMEQELLAEEETDDFLEDFDPELREELELTPDDLRPGKNLAVDFSRAVYEDESDIEADYVPPTKKKKGVGGLVFLALMEILGILAIIGWWKQWLT